MRECYDGPCCCLSWFYFSPWPWRVCCCACLGIKTCQLKSFFALSAAPGGKLCPFLHLHSGPQEWLPKHPAVHHGEYRHSFAVSIATSRVCLVYQNLSTQCGQNKLNIRLKTKAQDCPAIQSCCVSPDASRLRLNAVPVPQTVKDIFDDAISLWD